MRHLLLGGAVFLALQPVTAMATAPESNVPRDDLLGLAAKFVDKIGAQWKNLPPAAPAEPLSMAPYDMGTPVLAPRPEQSEDAKVLSLIPDGETLLLRPRVNRIFYDGDIYALKERAGIYYDLQDVLTVFELAVQYDQEKGIAQGWFLREDWPITIDFKAGRVISRDQVIDIAEDDVIERDGILFVHDKALLSWMDMDMSAKLYNQSVEVYTPHPLPMVARVTREQKTLGSERSTIIAELPRQAPEYEWLDINAARFNGNVRVTQRPDSEDVTKKSSSVGLGGQLLKHSFESFVNADNNEGVQFITARLSKQDENANLLGPLKARSYRIGDTDLVSLPLAGGVQQEFGFRFNNNPLENTNFQSTNVSGDALPGWDIELYRDGLFVDTLRVADDGRYQFDDVPLFIGDNVFELFFYGPQGEIRSENFTVPVTAELLNTQNNTYDVSVSLAETNTYSKMPSEDEDRETLHIAALYNTYIGNTLYYAGFRNRDLDGENKTFINAGATEIIGDFLVNLNFGMDEELNSAAEILARTELDEWKISLTGKVAGEDYSPEQSEVVDTMNVSASAQKAFQPFLGTRANFLGQLAYSEASNDTQQYVARVGYGHQFGRANLNSNLDYTATQGGSTTTPERLNWNNSFRASFGRFSLRGGANYQIKPESAVERYFGQVNYNYSSRIASDLSFSHRPEADYTDARLNVTYSHDKFRTSPFIEYDSNDVLQAGVNLNFSLIKPPTGFIPYASNQNVIGTAQVSAFVFHDKNGNMVFDDADEPLPQVIVESVNVRRRVETAEDGYALIERLPGNRATDIRVDNSSLPDPFMMASYEGASILPGPGEMVKMKFPIHVSGEIDGTIGVRKKNGLLESVRSGFITLLSLDDPSQEALQTNIAGDGFFVISQIPPGRYWMSASKGTARDNDAAPPAPRIVDIGFDGTVLYSQNVELYEATPYVPLSVKPITEAPLWEYAAGRDILYTLEVMGAYDSKLGRVLSMFLSQRRGDVAMADMVVLPVADQDEVTARYMAPDGKYDVLYQRCQLIRARGKECRLTAFIPGEANKIVATTVKNGQAG